MQQLLAVAVDGVIYSAWLFIAALGLTLIYGVMKIVNVTHGSFYALGAYAGASLTGIWLALSWQPDGAVPMRMSRKRLELGPDVDPIAVKMPLHVVEDRLRDPPLRHSPQVSHVVARAKPPPGGVQLDWPHPN